MPARDTTGKKHRNYATVAVILIGGSIRTNNVCKGLLERF